MPGEREVWKTNRVVYRRKPKPQRALFSKMRLLVLLCVLGLGILYLGLYQIFHLPYFQVAYIDVRGGETISSDKLKIFLKESLAGDRWGLFPKSNILFLSPRRTEAALQGEYPEIQSVIVEKQLPQTIRVTISERAIWAVYCSEEPVLCSFIDGEGVIFRAAPMVQGSLILTIHSENPLPPLGTIVFSPEEISLLQQFQSSFENVGVPVTGFQLKQNSPKDFWIKTKEGFFVVVIKEAHPEETANIVKTVLEKEVGGRRGSLEYLDARFGNKVFVKYR